MDSKAVFVRTSKGEAEISGKTADLYSAIKRVLLMVDGVATFGEISKRVAPSMRNSLDEMFQELEKGGFIRDKVKAGKVAKMSVPTKMAVPPKMSEPSKMAAPPAAPPQTPPPINESAKQSGGELDFMDEFFSKTPAQILAEAAQYEKHEPKNEAKPKQDNNDERLKAQQQAEAILRKAEQDAARIREEAEREKQRAAAEISAREEKTRRAKEEAEAARVKAMQEAEQLQKELEASRLKAEQEARARIEADAKERLEAAAKAQQQAEAERLKAAQEAVLAHEAAERLARIEREAAKARLEEELRAQQQAEAERAKAAREAALAQEVSERIAQLEREAAAAREEADRLARQRASEQLPKKTTGSVPESNPAPEIKLDPFFVFEPFQIPASSTSSLPTPPAAKPKMADIIQPEPEIKLDALDIVVPKGGPLPVTQPVESKPAQEQIKQTDAQRIAAEAKAKKQAEARTKAEAERREVEAAMTRAEIERQEAEALKAKVDLTFQKTLPPSTKPAVQRVPAYRTNRKPFPWGKLLIFMLALLVGALYIVPYVLPMRDYMPKVQEMLSAKLQQPVHIGQLGGRILPTPRLELGEIYIGDVKQLQIRQALIDFSVMGLLEEIKPIDSVELKGVKVTGAGLQPATAWLQQLAADNQYPVRRMVISEGALDADAIQFSGISGELNFNQAGKFIQANLHANGGKIALVIDAAPESRLQVAITMFTSALPLLPSWSFEELTAKGELSSNGLKISEFDGRMLGGKLQGDASIEWRSGWRAKGTFVAKTFTMENIAKGLSGNMEGSGRFQMQATSLSRLADTATLDGTFVVKNGVINGIDVVETARSRSKESMPGGRTHFDDLSGVLSVDQNSVSLRQVKMNAGEFVALGTIDIVKQQLSGKISADLTKWSGMGKVTMLLGGTTDNPALVGEP